MRRHLEALVPKLHDHIATLGEGNTPLVRSTRIGLSLGVKNLYFKYGSLRQATRTSFIWQKRKAFAVISCIDSMCSL